MPDALFVFIACAVPAACLLAGMSWPRFRFAPLVATGVIVLTYVAFIVGLTIWASQCWECASGGDLGRRGVLEIVLLFYWIPAAGLIAIVWLGALVALVAQLWAEARRRQRAAGLSQ